MGKGRKFVLSVAWRRGGDVEGKIVLTIAIFIAASPQNLSG